ncbi:hypothetical protein SAMD00019534_107940 [Acytostelium subglobosum LB1]|uniref:hypothetical protein n=1 Tax=Acytostelium subglobosum LB1 TaxID=1410327 RepID=UPI000644CEFB|nr:hypothetical protein SAMD00019534_107940 [Acytostelium subglobosum LB1]GAM27618.1 hypothetical protein SAMD00019534_107940 [Acytostelium subglobosum LB1]|eukprot:XP_012749277.1 hypothetical protein SAMD00019534_107940 [Acytostelium subglobosum LB1]
MKQDIGHTCYDLPRKKREKKVKPQANATATSTTPGNITSSPSSSSSKTISVSNSNSKQHGNNNNNNNNNNMSNANLVVHNGINVNNLADSGDGLLSIKTYGLSTPTSSPNIDGLSISNNGGGGGGNNGYTFFQPKMFCSPTLSHQNSFLMSTSPHSDCLTPPTHGLNIYAHHQMGPPLDEASLVSVPSPTMSKPHPYLYSPQQHPNQHQLLLLPPGVANVVGHPNINRRISVEYNTPPYQHMGMVPNNQDPANSPPLTRKDIPSNCTSPHMFYANGANQQMLYHPQQQQQQQLQLSPHQAANQSVPNPMSSPKQLSNLNPLKRSMTGFSHNLINLKRKNMSNSEPNVLSKTGAYVPPTSPGVPGGGSSTTTTPGSTSVFNSADGLPMLQPQHQQQQQQQQQHIFSRHHSEPYDMSPSSSLSNNTIQSPKLSQPGFRTYEDYHIVPVLSSSLAPSDPNFLYSRYMNKGSFEPVLFSSGSSTSNSPQYVFDPHHLYYPCTPPPGVHNASAAPIVNDNFQLQQLQQAKVIGQQGGGGNTSGQGINCTQPGQGGGATTPQQPQAQSGLSQSQNQGQVQGQGQSLPQFFSGVANNSAPQSQSQSQSQQQPQQQQTPTGPLSGGTEVYNYG